MWTIIKFNKKYFNHLKNDLKKNLGADVKIYNPKILVQKFKNNRPVNFEYSILGDYLFCFHKEFQNPQTLQILKFAKGLKYFLNGCTQSQAEINQFINHCKVSENNKGYLSQNFFKVSENTNYRFSSGPFSEKIFKIISLQKNKIDILLGNIKTTIKNKDLLFTPV